MINLEKLARIHRQFLDYAAQIESGESQAAFFDAEGIRWSRGEVASFPQRLERIRNYLKNSRSRYVIWSHPNSTMYPYRGELNLAAPEFYGYERLQNIAGCRLFHRSMLDDAPLIQTRITVRQDPCCRTNALGYVCPCPTPAHIPEEARKVDPYREHQEPVLHPPPRAEAAIERMLRHPLAHWSLRNGGRRR